MNSLEQVQTDLKARLEEQDRAVQQERSEKESVQRALQVAANKGKPIDEVKTPHNTALKTHHLTLA